MLYNAQQGNFCLMAAGDMLISQRLAAYTEPQYLALRALVTTRRYQLRQSRNGTAPW